MSAVEDLSRRRGGRDARRAMRARPIPMAEAAVRPGMVGGQYKPLTDLDTAHLTAEGTITGSPLFMSPEQAKGDVAKIGPNEF